MSTSSLTFLSAFLFLATGLGEGFQMRWCTISAEETSKCNDFKTVIATLASQASLPAVTFSCVQGSNAVDCMAKIQSGQADLITLSCTLDGGEILTAGKMHDMVPIVSEDYESGAPTTSYFAVAVVKKDSGITFNNLKGKKSCHTGAGKTAGWNVPVGFLLSKNIMPTDDSCNAYTAAGKFFYKSCVSNVKTSTYDPKGTNPSNLCALCTDECNRSGKYSGYSGAFQCLKDGVGDVAFIKHTTMPSAYASQVMYLCKDGSTKANWNDNCYLAQVSSHAVMVKRGNTNNANYKRLLLDASNAYGINQTNSSMFQLFESFKYMNGRDLLFKDSAKKLVDVGEKDTYQKWLGDDYLRDLEALYACPTTSTTPSTLSTPTTPMTPTTTPTTPTGPSAGGNINNLQSLVAMISAFIAALCYTGTLFE